MSTHSRQRQYRTQIEMGDNLEGDIFVELHLLENVKWVGGRGGWSTERTLLYSPIRNLEGDGCTPGETQAVRNNGGHQWLHW